MQPVCGIPGERITSAKMTLDGLACGAADSLWLCPILFLCGLKYGLTRFETTQLVGHIVDDGLAEITPHALKVLLAIAKADETKETFETLWPGSMGWEFGALKIAFIQLDHKLPENVKEWLSAGVMRENRCRLTVSMAVHSLFDSYSYPFLTRLSKAKFSFLNGENKDCGSEIQTLVSSFIYDPSWALPL